MCPLWKRLDFSFSFWVCPPLLSPVIVLSMTNTLTPFILLSLKEEGEDFC